MPKFARPNSYTGKQANQQWTGDSRFATLPETLAGDSLQLSISPGTLAAAGVTLIPDATTTVKGKVELATNAEAVTGTDATNKAIVPASLTARLASPGAIGGTAPAGGAFTTLSATSTMAAGTTVTAGTGIVATTGNITAAAGNLAATLGSVTAGTTVTATLGAITATNGNLVLAGAGNKLMIHATTAANDSVGTSAALDGASPSQLVVACTSVTAESKIFLTYNTVAGTAGSLSVGTIVAGTSFQIKSSANGDTSTVNYLIIN